MLDWRDDPELKRMKYDVYPSDSSGLALGIRQSKTQRDGRICTNIGLENLEHIQIGSTIFHLILLQIRSVRMVQFNPEVL